MAQTRLKSGNLHMVGGDNGSSGQVLKSKGDGTMEWGVGTTPPTFSSVDYPGDDTALDPAGGQSLVINGGGFLSGINVKVGGTNAASVTLNSVTQITIVTPAKAAGTYALEFTNTDGGNATANSAVSYNGVPAFTNAAGSLGAALQGSTVNLSVAATEPDGGAITHTITTGSLPSGLSLNATTGAITGTAPDVNAPTTTSFSITATDNENQSTVRAYSITINPILPSDDFKVLSYTGNGSGQSITGLSFQPDFVWLKKTNADNEHLLMHPNVGTGEYYRPSYASQGRLINTDTITALNSNGFTLGSYSQANNNNDSFVAYCWKINGGTKVNNTDGTNSVSTEVNAAKGISVITYSGNGSTQTVGHGLGKVPELFFMMDRYNGGGWRVWHKDLDGPNKYLEMGSGGQSTSSTIWNNTLPTSTVFSLGNVVPPNGSGRAHVCWAFTSIDKHSKFSSYTGNGANSGPIIDLGFEPALLMIRRIDSGDHFYMFDHQRETSNPRNTSLRMNHSAAEGDITGDGVIFLSNGFQPITSDGALNADNGKYIYMAWAADPDVTAPTLANSFNAKAYSGNSGTNTITGVGFKPDLIWLKERSGTDRHVLIDTIRGTNSQLSSNDNNAVTTYTSNLNSFNADGFTLGGATETNGNGETYISWNWKGNDNEPTGFAANAVAVYKFEDNANDVGGNHNGTASNVTYSSSGKFNKAAEFNGSSSYVDVSYGHSNTSFSWSMWVNADSFSNSYPTVIGGMNNSTNTNNGTIWMNSTKIVIHGSTLYGEVAFSFSASTWYHVGMVYDSAAGTVKAIINGQLYTPSSTTSNTFNSQNKMRIGRADADSTAWDGKIDQVRFYKGAISDVGVAELYEETVSQNDDLQLGGPLENIVNANNNAGFSIVKFKNISPGSTVRVPHGLSAAPNMILLKRTDGTENWYVYHSEMGTSKYMRLDTSAAQGTATNLFNTVNSTVFNPSFTNDAGQQLIAYCFRDIAGYQKFGSYTGNNNATGPTVTTGFQPNFVLIKRTDATSNWNIYDTSRDSSNPSGPPSYPNLNNAEGGSQAVNFLSNGFQPAYAGGDLNENNGNYIYWAIKIN